MRTKRFIILLVTIPLLLVALGFGYYVFSQYRSQSKTLPSGRSSPPAAAAAGPRQLVRGPAISPVLSFDGKKVWYLTAEGKLFRQEISSGSKPEEYQFSSPPQNPASIIWPKDGNDFIMVQGSGGQLSYQFFNSRKNSFAPYAQALSKPQFLFTSDKIVYQWASSPTAAQLVLSNSDGTSYRKVADLFSPNFQFVASPQKPEIALFSTDPNNPLKLFIVDLLTGQFRALTDKAAFSGARFSPDGTKLLVAAAIANQNNSNNSGSSLLVYHLSTGDLQDVGLASDMDHVAWSKDSSFLVLGSKAGFTKYNFSSFATEDLFKFKDTDNFDPVQLFLHPSEPVLFFVDKNTGNLYRLDLK